MPLQEHRHRERPVAAGVRGDDVAGFRGPADPLRRSYSASYTGATTSRWGPPARRNSTAAVPSSGVTTNLDLTREFDVGDGSLPAGACPSIGRSGTRRRLASRRATPTAACRSWMARTPVVRPRWQPAGPWREPGGSRKFDRTRRPSTPRSRRLLRRPADAVGRRPLRTSTSAAPPPQGRRPLEVVEGLRPRLGGPASRAGLAAVLLQPSAISFINGQPLSVRLVSVNDAIAPLIGAQALTRRSPTTSVGAVFELGGLTATDYYRIEIRDRLVISSNFSSTALTNLLAPTASGINAVAYVTNAVDSTSTAWTSLRATATIWMAGVGGHPRGQLQLVQVRPDRRDAAAARRARHHRAALRSHPAGAHLLGDAEGQDHAEPGLERGPLTEPDQHYGEVSQVALTNGRRRRWPRHPGL